MSIYLVFATTTAAYAAPSVGGWTAVDTVIAGATTTINATKTIGGKLMQSAVTVAPSAAKVGKHLIRGGGAAALALAVPQLLGEGVDWVLDPANNSVRYTVAASDNPDNPALYSHYVLYKGVRYYTKESYCAAAYANSSNAPADYIAEDTGAGFRCRSDEGTFAATSKIPNSVYDPDAGAAPQEKHIPIETVADKVISEAESGNVPSQEAVKAAALEGFESGEHDAALEAGATEADTSNPPDTTDPAAPAEPFDPSSIIDAIKKLGAILTGILSSITSLSDMFGDSPSNAEDTEVPIDDAPPIRAPTEFDTEYVNFGGQCPSFGSHDISVGSVSVPLTIDITPLCELAELVRPAVIGGAYLVATGLVVAAIREA